MLGAALLSPPPAIRRAGATARSGRPTERWLGPRRALLGAVDAADVLLPRRAAAQEVTCQGDRDALEAIKRFAVGGEEGCEIGRLLAGPAGLHGLLELARGLLDDRHDDGELRIGGVALGFGGVEVLAIEVEEPDHLGPLAAASLEFLAHRLEAGGGVLGGPPCFEPRLEPAILRRPFGSRHPTQRL